MDDNLSLSDNVKQRYAKMYSGVFAKRYIEGKWVVADGLIYDMFKKEHIIEPEEIPYDDIHNWCIGVDYGTGNATVFLLMGKDSNGIIYICKEYYFAGRQEAQKENNYDAQKTDGEFTSDMKDFINENYNLTGKVYRSGLNGMQIVVDPAAASFILEMRRKRLSVKRADNSVLDGIRTVATYMGEDRLRISTECTNTLREIHSYSWDSKAQLHGDDRPTKKDDHCCITGDTLINTTDGMIRIDELVGKSGYVNTIDPETNTTCVKKFYNVRKTREDANVMIIGLQTGKLRLTSDHKVLTTEGWKTAGELKFKDRIVTNDGKSIMVYFRLNQTDLTDVYNMEVEDVHCFAVTNDNVIIHNCDAMRYGVMKLRDKNKLSNAARNIGL